MVTYLIDSKAAIAKSQQITQAIDDGLLPKPPTTGTRIYKCDRCDAKTPLTVPSRYAKGRVCADCAAMLEWISVKMLINGKAVHISEPPTIGYDPTCGVQPRQRFALELLLETFSVCVELELETINKGYSLEHMTRRYIECEGFNSAAHIYLAAVGNCGLGSKTNSYTNIDMAWHATVAYDYYARRRYPVKFTVERPPDAPHPSPAPRSDAQQPEPVVLPQQLQSKEDILEAIAMSKVDRSQERLTELYEAVIFGVEHYEKEEARTIFDGFFLRASPSGVFVHLAHTEHPNHITVGMTDMLTNKMEFCSSRGELKDFAHRVVAGMAPSTNTHLPGILMQQPIPDDAKQGPLRSGNNQHAEVAPDELPLFARDNPEPAA